MKAFCHTESVVVFSRIRKSSDLREGFLKLDEVILNTTFVFWVFPIWSEHEICVSQFSQDETVRIMEFPCKSDSPIVSLNPEQAR